jgi:aryl-alcohol dehydrogenase-like predicted oxidoreductase
VEETFAPVADRSRLVRPASVQTAVPVGARPPTALWEPAPATGPITLRQRRIGHTDLRVFPLALSGGAFGAGVSRDVAVGILDAYRDLGGNIVDTDDGAGQEIVGRWMRDRGLRDEFVIATRVGRGSEHPGVGVRAVTRAVEGSLRRLRTDRIDLLSLHLDDESVPFEETMLAASALVSAGKVRHIGLSDHSANRVIEARVIAAQYGAAPVVAVQAEYSLLSRAGYETALAGVARQLSLAVMPRLALAAGLLARGRPTAGALGRRSSSRAGSPRITFRVRRVLAVVEEVAREQHVAPASVALAWLLTKRGVVAPVVGASAPEQVLDLVAAVSLRLTRQQITALDRVSETRRGAGLGGLVRRVSR